MSDRVITVLVDGAVRQMINTETAVAADYISFMAGVVEALGRDKNTLENQANLNGRTLKSGFGGVGSIPLDQ